MGGRTVRVTVASARTMVETMRNERAAWPIRRYRLGEEPPDDPAGTTTPAERLAMMWQLAREGWLLSGRPLPTYDRANLPSRFFRRGERPDDE